jgi:hypothetical protein
MCGSGTGTARHSEHVVASVTEPASCSYVITISTPRLCKHPAFRKEPPPVDAIKCIPRPKPGEAGGGEQAGEQAGDAAASGAVVALPSPAEGQCTTPGAAGAPCASPIGSEGAGADSSSRSKGSSSSGSKGGSSSGSGGTGSEPGGEGRPSSEEPPKASSRAGNWSASGEEEPEEEYDSLVEGEPKPEDEGEAGVDEGVWVEMYDAALQEPAHGEEAEDDNDALLGGRDEL